MRKQLFFTLSATILLLCQWCIAQNKNSYKSWNPEQDTINVVQGRGWDQGFKSIYDRLPASAEKQVRDAVWKLSNNSAGLSIRFRTNAEEIVVKLKVTGGLQMPHMPATGVSGVDLYTKNIDGKWLWCAGQYSFGDTVSYRFTNISGKDQQVNDREYTLYLPLYNSVKWMEISVPTDCKFSPISVPKEKPIVVYGTSIAQGACASRPGMAWTSIVGRKLDRPIVNLGFSGNGKLEPEVIDYVTQIDAKLYILDCLPNLTGTRIPAALVKRKIVDAVTQIQTTRPGTPILFTEHDGYTDGEVQQLRKEQYEMVNKVLDFTLDSLKRKGVKGIYLLTKNEIGQDIDSMVDGVHPSDLGMMHYAEAYEKKFRSIFEEPLGRIATTIPVTQRRDASTYDWETRHRQVLEYAATNKPELIFIGNSITHFWGGRPAAPIPRGEDSWQKFFGESNAMNMGFGWDRIENVLWRIYHGELDGFAPKQIVVMIGTNNLQYNTDADILVGLKALMQLIREKQPKAHVLLMGILPRRGMEARVAKLNTGIHKLSEQEKIPYADAGMIFLEKGKTINESLFSDGLHPNKLGYEKLGGFISHQISLKGAK